MRYRELFIETQRQAPANARTAGFAWLSRAGYLTRQGEPTRLGQQALTRLKSLARSTDFFARLALPIIETEDGGKFFAISAGGFEILQCSTGDYAARRELARFRKPMLLPEDPQPLERIPTPDCDTIESLAAYLGVPSKRTAKALMFTRPADGRFIFVVVRGDMQLSHTKLEALTGPVRPATGEEIAASGAAAGYASPVGLRGVLVAVDDVIPDSVNLVAGANQAGYHLRNVNYGRDFTAAIMTDLAMAGPGDACPNCSGRLVSIKAELLSDGSSHHFDAILTALAEVHHDDRGLTLPSAAAPFDVYLMNVPGKELDTRTVAEELYAGLESAGLAVLYDDRDERAGVKFNDADLIGPPLRLTVGEKNLREGLVEVKARTAGENRLLRIDEIPGRLKP